MNALNWRSPVYTSWFDRHVFLCVVKITHQTHGELWTWFISLSKNAQLLSLLLCSSSHLHCLYQSCAYCVTYKNACNHKVKQVYLNLSFQGSIFQVCRCCRIYKDCFYVFWVKFPLIHETVKCMKLFKTTLRILPWKATLNAAEKLDIWTQALTQLKLFILL